MSLTTEPLTPARLAEDVPFGVSADLPVLVTCDGCGLTFDFDVIHLTTDHRAFCAGCANEAYRRLYAACERWSERNVRDFKGATACDVQDADRKRLRWLYTRSLPWWADHADCDAEWLMNGFKADTSACREYFGQREGRAA